MKRLFSVFLLLCLTVNSFAASGSTDAILKAVDEYQYAMTVEWDQKDQAFYNTQSDLFLKRLSASIKESGLSKEDVLALAEKKMNNKKSFDALKLKMSLLGNDLSSEELAKTLKESSKEFYQTGASWNGAAGEKIMIGVVVLLIGYAIWFSATHECVETEERYSCETETYCRSYDFNGNCSWWDSEEVCGYTDVCTKYERR